MTLRVPFAASSVAVARRQLRAWMADQGGSREAIENARIIVSELVANCIRHAEPLPDGSLLIAWVNDRHRVRVSVTDGGSPTRPHTVDAPSSALAGRGMAIVETLAESWWAERRRGSSTVHAVLSLG